MKYHMLFFILVAFASLVQNNGTQIRVKSEDVLYFFRSRINRIGIAVTAQEASNAGYINTVFDRTKKTVVLIHGWKDNQASNFSRYISESFFDTTDLNVIVVDWSKDASRLYILAKHAVPKVANISAVFFKQFTTALHYPLDNIKLVGFSLGAHIAGIIGKCFQGSLPLIVGLDPARPLINRNDRSYSLNSHDAKYVQVIHSDGGSSGIMEVVGDSDFYPNGGKNQHGCSGLGCSHDRAWVYYAESIRQNHFVAQRCNNYSEYQSHLCKGSNAVMGGLNVDLSARGTYYLTTNSYSPFGRGQELVRGERKSL